MKKLLLCVIMAYGHSVAFPQNYFLAEKAHVATLKQQESETVTSNEGYKLPVGLSNIGSLSAKDQPVCNLLVNHRAINGGAHYLASASKAVTFFNNNQSATTQYWVADGTIEKSTSSVNASFTYGTKGVFTLPTLKDLSTGKSYTPSVKIKVGGQSEITTMDCSLWKETYLLGTLPYAEGGWCGGNNSLGVDGWGNLFMLGTDDCYLDGVNIYLDHKPTHKSSSKIRIQAWMVNISSSDINLTYLPIDGVEIPMDNIKADGEDGAWALTNGGAVINAKFTSPVSLYGKTPIFISVEGFNSDSQDNDFVILCDLKGKRLSEIDGANMLSHNSFGRMSNEDSYLRPVSSFGGKGLEGGDVTFAICPVVTIPDEALPTNSLATGIRQIKAPSKFFASFHNDQLFVVLPQSANVTVYDTQGKLVASCLAAAGSQLIDINRLPKGIYLIKTSTGYSLKALKK